MCLALLSVLLINSDSLAQAPNPGNVTNSSFASTTTAQRVIAVGSATTAQGFTLVGIDFELGDYVAGAFVARAGTLQNGTFNAATGNYTFTYNGVTNNPNTGYVVVRAVARYRGGRGGAVSSTPADATVTVIP